MNKKYLKKILILAYDFPPYVSVGGLRPFAWSKYLLENNVYPVIITRQWANKYGNKLDYIAPGESNNTIIERSKNSMVFRTPYKSNLSNRLLLKYGDKKYKCFRKIITAYYEFFQWFFFVGPKSNIYAEANKYLSKDKVDVIIATGDPFILFRYASILSKKYNIPWIADYRDPWTQNKKNSKNLLIRIFNKYIEKKHLKDVGLIISVSAFFKEKMYSLIQKPFIIIENGYDPEISENALKVEQSGNCLNVGFAGTIQQWHPLRIFLNSVMKINDNENIKIKVNFYGINIPDELRNIINTEYIKLKEIIQIYPKTPNSELLLHLSKNNLLVLFNDYYFVGTKIYDYLAINRTIVLCFSNDKEAQKLKEKYYNYDENNKCSKHIQEDIIRETNSGFIAENGEHLIDLLKNLYNEFKLNGYIACKTQNIEKYSRREQTKQLAKIITMREF